MPTESETDRLRLVIRQAVERLATIRMDLLNATAGYPSWRPGAKAEAALQGVIDDLLPHTSKPAELEPSEEPTGPTNERDEPENFF